MHKIVLLLIGFGLILPVLSAARVEAQQPLGIGGVLSGELNAVSTRANGKRITTYQIVSEARKLPEPDGLCNLETGPETFQLVTRDDNDVKTLKKFVGKTISVKATALACPQEPTDVAEAVVKSWTLAP